MNWECVNIRCSLRPGILVGWIYCYEMEAAEDGPNVRLIGQPVMARIRPLHIWTRTRTMDGSHVSAQYLRSFLWVSGCCRPLFNQFPWSPEARLRLPWSAFTTRSYASNYGSQLQRERLKGPRLKFTSSDLSLTLYDPNPTWTAVYRKCPKTAWVAQGKIFLEYPHVLCFVLKLSRA